MPYTSERPLTPPSSDELRKRIPGWGADLDPQDRPSFPRERTDLPPTGAHWDLPEAQREEVPRERSIEHERLTPVFGTSMPMKGASGVLRRLAYSRYSEGRAAHWLILLGADRVDAIESHLRSFVTLRPDNPFTETGLGAERRYHGVRSRFGRGRADTKHQWLDPIIVAGPWVVLLWILVRMIRGTRRRS